MIKDLFLVAILISVTHMHAMEKECSPVLRFPQEIKKRIIHYLIALNYESEEEFIKRTKIARPLFFPDPHKSYVSLHTVARAPSGNVMGRLEKSRYINSDLWDITIDLIDLSNKKKLQKIYYQLAYDPVSIDFNLQGTQIIIHTSKGEPDIYPLYKEVQKLSAVHNNHLKMLLLQKFFEQQNH